MHWEKEILYTKNSLFFERLFEAISQAQFSIYLETYIFENDKMGRKVFLLLNEAVLRGVHVRLLVDAVGSKIPFFRKPFFDQGALFDYKIYHPFNFRFKSLNKRNHRKICIIDGSLQSSVGFIGSQNITSVHLEVDKGGEGWRDVAVFLGGEELKEVEKSLSRTWNKKRGISFNKVDYSLKKVRLNNTFRSRRFYFKDLLDKINNAQTRVWVCTPYFVPDKKILDAFQKAAKNGVDVRIMLPRTSDVFFMPWVAVCFYEKLLQSQVKVYEYYKSFMHAKILIVDDWVSVGSTNLNHRSIFHDLEVDVVLTHRENQMHAREVFLSDLLDAKEISLSELNKRPFWVRWLGRIILIFRYYL